MARGGPYVEHTIRIAGATPATVEDLHDGARAPSIASLIRVSPSRDVSRGLNDRLRAMSGGDPAELVGPRGLAFVRQGGIAAAVAVGRALRRGGPPSDAPDDAVLASDDLGGPCYDVSVVPTDAFAWDARRLALSIFGQAMLDCVMVGPEWPERERGEAHLWAQELELLLRVGPASASDAAALVHAQTLAELACVELRDMSVLLRAACALVEPSVVAASIAAANAPSSVVDLFADHAPPPLEDFVANTTRAAPVRIARSPSPTLAVSPPPFDLFD